MEDRSCPDSVDGLIVSRTFRVNDLRFGLWVLWESRSDFQGPCGRRVRLRRPQVRQHPQLRKDAVRTHAARPFLAAGCS